MTSRLFALGFAVLGAAAVPVRAEILLEGVQWQAAEGVPSALKFKDVAALSLRKGALKARLRAKVKVRNASPASAEGVLLRYSMAARLAPAAAAGGDAAEGAWAVPFMVEEKRVPFIGAQQTVEAKLDPTVLVKLYLAHVAQAGYRALELKLQVMVEPQRGGAAPIRTIENMIKITE